MSTVYSDGNKIIYRASGLGTCPKALAALRAGYEALPWPKEVQARMDAGTNIEQTAIDQLVADGWKIYDQQLEVDLYLTGKIVVRGHIDGKGYYQDRGYVIEVKSQSQGEWDKFERNGWDDGFFPKYKWQVSAYALATGLGIALVRYNRDTAELSVSFVDEPWYSLDQIRQRVLGVEALASQADLGVCEQADWPCPVRYLHVDDDVELADEEVELLAKEYKAAGRDRNVAEGRRKAAYHALLAAAGDSMRLKTEGGYKITFFYKKNRASYNEAKMSEEDKAVLEKYKVQTESLQVRITEPTEPTTDQQEDDGEHGEKRVGEGRDQKVTD